MKCILHSFQEALPICKILAQYLLESILAALCHRWYLSGIYTELENISHSVDKLQIKHTNVVGIHVCDNMSTLQKAVYREQEDAFAFFNFLSQQSITLVLFLATSNIDVLHTQDRENI